MSKTYFKFNYSFESNLSEDNLDVEVSCNSSDLDEVLEKFQGFLVASGFDATYVHASVNNSDLLPCKDELNVTCDENRIDYRELYEIEMKRRVELEQELESMKFLFDTENSLKVAYKKELIAAGLLDEEVINENDD